MNKLAALLVSLVVSACVAGEEPDPRVPSPGDPTSPADPTSPTSPTPTPGSTAESCPGHAEPLIVHAAQVEIDGDTFELPNQCGLFFDDDNDGVIDTIDLGCDCVIDCVRGTSGSDGGGAGGGQGGLGGWVCE